MHFWWQHRYLLDGSNWTVGFASSHPALHPTVLIDWKTIPCVVKLS